MAAWCVDGGRGTSPDQQQRRLTKRMTIRIGNWRDGDVYHHCYFTTDIQGMLINSFSSTTPHDDTLIQLEEDWPLHLVNADERYTVPTIRMNLKAVCIEKLVLEKE